MTEWGHIACHCHCRCRRSTSDNYRHLASNDDV